MPCENIEIVKSAWEEEMRISFHGIKCNLSLFKYFPANNEDSWVNNDKSLDYSGTVVVTCNYNLI